jgi:hypothetical protein
MIPKLVKTTVVAFPRYGPDATTDNRFEQSDTPEVNQIDCAPMLNLVRRAEM